ncbi:MAG: sulfite exporter TauE/SafE family protein [Candidatus Hadarchaeum sp.]|uniref:sulfite exporter TauE/SafE family protein n=1 Tax=Candidatus Hadarchaeum sp. TaxID=2883567 RepID=UPI0031745AE9
MEVGIEVLILLPFVSFLVAFFTAPAGVSGAFLLLPFQVSVLGFTSPSVSATNLVYNLIAIPSGVYRYIREGRMAWPIASLTILATLPGVFIGAVIRANYFLDPRVFKFFVGLVLLYLGLRVLISALRPSEKIKELEKKFKERIEMMKKRGLPEEAVVRTRKVSLSRIEYEFWGEIFSFNVPSLFLVSFAIGIIGGIYGIGGGAILSPILASIFGLPTYTIAGATLLGTFLTSVFGIASYYAINYPPNWAIGISLGIGGFFGMYFGARFQKYLPERTIRFCLSAVIFVTAINYILQFFL